jgi:hypothetical protein
VNPVRRFGRRNWRERRYVPTGQDNEAGKFYRGSDLRGVGCGMHKLRIRLTDRPRR